MTLFWFGPKDPTLSLPVISPEQQAMDRIVQWLSTQMQAQQVSIRDVADALDQTEDWIVELLQDPGSKDLSLRDVTDLEHLFETPYFTRPN